MKNKLHNKKSEAKHIFKEAGNIIQYFTIPFFVYIFE
jgi:hypothetical protein